MIICCTCECLKSGKLSRCGRLLLSLSADSCKCAHGCRVHIVLCVHYRHHQHHHHAKRVAGGKRYRSRTTRRGYGQSMNFGKGRERLSALKQWPTRPGGWTAWLMPEYVCVCFGWCMVCACGVCVCVRVVRACVWWCVCACCMVCVAGTLTRHQPLPPSLPYNKKTRNIVWFLFPRRCLQRKKITIFRA